MNTNKINYSRLEIHIWNGFKNPSLNREEKSISGCYHPYVYVEEYANYSLLKNRILELVEIAKNKDIEKPEKSDAYDESNLSFLIYNRDYDWKKLGISSKGWLLNPNYYFGYLCSYFYKKYGKPDFTKHLDLIKKEKENVSFVSSDGEGLDINEIELVSEHLLDILLQDFFEPGIISKEALDKACYQEMIDKGYIS
jgi:hypothetical protein